MTTSTTSTSEEAVPAPLWRRLLSIVYDALIVACLVFIAWQPIPFVLDNEWPQWLSQTVRQGYLLLVVFCFFGWFWTHGGQTIGMRAWKIRVINSSSDPITDATLDAARLRVSWGQALLRFLIACLSLAAVGLGFLWSLFNDQKKTWHDIASKTRLVEIV